MERILDAGRVVLVRDGYDPFSTNRVAAEAGVSPGSLYQYFPDKQSILDSVIDRWMAEVSDRVAASLADRIGADGPDVLRQVLDALVAALEVDAPLLRVVTEELPASRNRVGRLSIERRVRDLAKATLRHAVPADDLTATTWVLVLSIEQLAVRWVLDQPDLTREQLVDEMGRLTSSYLAAKR